MACRVPTASRNGASNAGGTPVLRNAGHDYMRTDQGKSKSRGGTACPYAYNDLVQAGTIAYIKNGCMCHPREENIARALKAKMPD
jgi:hypothetical protein